MLHKMYAICKAIDFIQTYSYRPVTGSRIVSTVTMKASRATKYRWISHAEKLGLIKKVSTQKSYLWSLTARGQEFMGGWNELPF